MKTLKIGDVVVLKSGGPKMTIAGETAHGLARCKWQDAKGQHQADYPEDALQKATDDKDIDLTNYI